MALGAWNLPPAMHRLTYLVGAIAVLSGSLTLRYGASWPLLARLTLGYVALVAVVVATAAATRWTAYAAKGMFFKNPRTGLIPWYWVVLLLPYHICCRVVCWFYRNSSGENVYDMIAPHLYLGGWPLNNDMLPSENTSIIDCTNELLRHVDVPAYLPLLVFESWAPEPSEMDMAVQWALAQQAKGCDVFCHCTHGHGRSAVTAAAILMGMGGAKTTDEALEKTLKARPGVKPNYRQKDMLREWAAAAHLPNLKREE